MTVTGTAFLPIADTSLVFERMLNRPLDMKEY